MSYRDLPQATKDRLERLLQLARRGVGGEAETAEVMLNRMLAEHGLTLADLEMQDEPSWHEFKPVGTNGRDLLLQTAHKVTNTSELKTGKRRGSKSVFIKVTKAQAAEIQVAYSVYTRAFKAEIDALMLAFINVNDIRSSQAGSVGRPLTDDERERIRRASAMAFGMDAVAVNPQLEHKAA